MSKIVAFWGPHGSGVSTTAANVALALADAKKIVTLMSTNLQYADAQIFFNQHIAKNKGLHMALADDTGHPENFLTQVSKMSENLFIMAVSNDHDLIFTDQLYTDQVTELYTRLGMCSDYIVLDVCHDINNALSTIGLVLASQVFTIYRASQKSYHCHKNMQSFMVRARLEDKTIPILNMKNIGMMPDDFSRATGLVFRLQLPEMDEAFIHEDAGEPIYHSGSISGKKYNLAIDSIKDLILKAGDVDAGGR